MSLTQFIIRLISFTFSRFTVPRLLVILGSLCLYNALDFTMSLGPYERNDSVCTLHNYLACAIQIKDLELSLHKSTFFSIDFCQKPLTRLSPHTSPLYMPDPINTVKYARRPEYPAKNTYHNTQFSLIQNKNFHRQGLFIEFSSPFLLDGLSPLAQFSLRLIKSIYLFEY